VKTKAVSGLPCLLLRLLLLFDKVCQYPFALFEEECLRLTVALLRALDQRAHIRFRHPFDPSFLTCSAIRQHTTRYCSECDFSHRTLAACPRPSPARQTTMRLPSLSRRRTLLQPKSRSTLPMRISIDRVTDRISARSACIKTSASVKSRPSVSRTNAETSPSHASVTSYC